MYTAGQLLAPSLQGGYQAPLTSSALREGAALGVISLLQRRQSEGPNVHTTGLQDVLDLVRGQDKDSFTCLLINWYRRAKGKYKVPTFAHQELDLHKVFWEVQDKGGYDQVTNFKLWKVCKPPSFLCAPLCLHPSLFCSSSACF